MSFVILCCFQKWLIVYIVVNSLYISFVLPAGVANYEVSFTQQSFLENQPQVDLITCTESGHCQRVVDILTGSLTSQLILRPTLNFT